MIKKDHLEVIRVPHTRHHLTMIAEIEKRLNESCGSENIDWWVEEYHQDSEVIFTALNSFIQVAKDSLKANKNLDNYQETLEKF